MATSMWPVLSCKVQKLTINSGLFFVLCELVFIVCILYLQCFDAVGWAAGRASSHEWWGAGMVICLERNADLHMAQLMPMPLTVSCFSKVQIGFTFLVLAHPGSPGQRAVKRVCVCVYIYIKLNTGCKCTVVLIIFKASIKMCAFFFYRPSYGPCSIMFLTCLFVCLCVCTCNVCVWWKHLSGLPSTSSFHFTFNIVNNILLILQCFDTVGWAAGRASGL